MLSLAHRAGPCLLVLVAACAHRVVTPAPPSPVPRAPDLANVDLYFGDFIVDNESAVDDAIDRTDLQTSLTHYLVAANQVRSVRARDDQTNLDPRRSLILEVVVHPQHSTGRTVVLDAFGWFLLGGLIVPVWGDAEVAVDVTLRNTDDRVIASYHREAYDEYWNVAYSWYRTKYVEDAYADAYEAVFESLAYQMAEDGPRIAAALGASVEVEEEVTDAGGDWHESAGTVAWADKWERPAPPPVPLDEQFLLIEEPWSPAVDASWYRVLSLFGGVELSTFYGFARVSSSIQDENEAPVEVGAGEATQTGYRIALYSAPDSTGFFWYPTLGYLHQNIAISGFRDSLNDSVADFDRDLIEPSCSDPATGAAVDCGAPSTYDLHMRSAYLGVRGGYELLAGNKWVQFLAAFGLGVNLMEYRSLRAIVGTYDETRKEFGGLVSGAAGGTIGLKFPSIHTSVRFIFDYELYRSFRYAEPVPFKGPPEWNADTRLYERPLRFATAAWLGSWTLQGGLAFVF